MYQTKLSKVFGSGLEVDNYIDLVVAKYVPKTTKRTVFKAHQLWGVVKTYKWYIRERPILAVALLFVAGHITGEKVSLLKINATPNNVRMKVNRIIEILNECNYPETPKLKRYKEYWY